MNFASDFVYEQPYEECESVCEDEFVNGMSVSSSEEEECNLYESSSGGKTKRLRSAKYHWKRKHGTAPGKSMLERECIEAEPGEEVTTRRRFRRADTNVVSVSFDTLLSPGNMHAGDPVHCPACSAILSHLSKLESRENSKVWPCEFCSEKVTVDLDEQEIPGTEDVTYLLSPAPATAHTSASGQDRSLVVFCVDTSGSMCVTSEISGKIKLRGTNQLRRLRSFQDDSADQFLPSQTDRSVTFVSRLQAMQAAVDHQLGQMARQHPDRRVSLVAFNNEVRIMGDGSQQEVVLAGDKLKDIGKLREAAQKATLPQAIKVTRSALGEKVYSLEEGGATALGPALVTSVNIAVSHPGSKVILCTDGKANIGLGKLEEDGGDAFREEEAQEFYNNTAQDAADKGVTVSVITIEGTDCKLVHLGALADKTGGQVNIVDPLKLTEEFGNILADPVIATKVKATFLLHKQLYVIDTVDPDNQQSRVEENVGNVKSSSTVTFEFAKRTEAAAAPTDGAGVGPDTTGTDGTAHAAPSDGTAHAAPSDGTTHAAPSDGTAPAAPSDGTAHAAPSGTTHAAPSDGTTHAEPPGGTTHAEPSGGTTHAEPSGGTTHAEPSGGTTHAEPSGGTTHAEPSGGTTHAGPSNATFPASVHEFPFQVQIEYMDTEGNKALRVITKRQRATSDRRVAESEVNLEVLGTHAAQKSAALALKGQYSNARGVALMNQRLAWRQAHKDKASAKEKTAYKNIFSKIKSMENFVQRRQMREIREYGMTRSDSEGDDDEGEAESERCEAENGRFESERGRFESEPVRYEAENECEEEVNLYCGAEPAARSLAVAAPPKPKSRSSILGRMFGGGKRSKSQIASKHKKMHSDRSSEMDDGMANCIYQFRSVATDIITAPGSSVSRGQNSSSSSAAPIAKQASSPIVEQSDSDSD